VLSFKPAIQGLRRAVGLSVPGIESAATERWMIAPATMRQIDPARHLPGQFDRIRAAEFGSVSDVVRVFEGGYEAREDETWGYRLKDVDLVDGVLYCGASVRHLRHRKSRSPAYVVPTEHARGAIYESWLGCRWFGAWLGEDCLTYPLAEQFGLPVTTEPYRSEHARDYARLLGHRPQRVEIVHFDELTLFDDLPNNEHKKARADDFRTRLAGSHSHPSHPGVYLVRGLSGDRRVLINEREIAEKLAVTRGFRVLDPMASSVEEIIAACAGARVVAGVEGSHLVHGLMLMPPQAALLTIQPPYRAVSWLKMFTDRQRQVFAFVVGTGGRQEFSVAWDDVERTLDLAVR
jgi:hypothetical protein